MDINSLPVGERPSRSNKPYFIVLVSGLITSAGALAAVYWFGHTADINIMGWYANLVIPLGAMLVGFAAGSGYAIASWLSGTRISNALLKAILFLQTGSYVSAEYIEYRNIMADLRPLGLVNEPTFPEYYDLKARTFTWKNKDGGKPNEPLGYWGYAFVLLGAGGFIVAGLFAPFILRGVPYCAACQRYMKTTVLGGLPASVPAQKISKKDIEAQQAHAAEQDAAAQKADESVARLQAAITDGEADAVKQELATGAIKAVDKLPKRVHVSLAWCRGCRDGHMAIDLFVSDGQNVQKVNLAQLPVESEFVGRMLAKS